MREFKNIFIRNLSKTYGDKIVLQNFNLTLAKGEFVTFLGPSGCGKSTALNCIAGLTPISSGDIFIDDECIDNGIKKVPAEKREFGMVFQNYALFPHLTVFNNIAFGLQLKKLPKDAIKAKVNNVLQLVHLEGYEDKFSAQMSGGEQQRVAIARCIVMEPLLLMLDEPLSNLDAKLRIDMRYELKTLHERLMTTSIYVTHDQQEALALSDRIVVMCKGVIQQIGTPEKIYSKPSNLFVADFMGFKNIWPSRIEKIIKNGPKIEFTITIHGITLLSIADSCDYDSSRLPALEKAQQDQSEVLIAARPEDVNVGESPLNQFHCQVGIVEYLGQNCQVSAFPTQVAEKRMRIILKPATRLGEGEQIPLWIAPEKLQLFPKEANAHVG